MRRLVWLVSKARRKASQSKRRRRALQVRLASIRMRLLNPKIYDWLADGCGKSHALTTTESVLPFLVWRGFHAKLGDRPMRDAIEKLLGNAVTEGLLAGKNACGSLHVNEPRGYLIIC